MPLICRSTSMNGSKTPTSSVPNDVFDQATLPVVVHSRNQKNCIHIERLSFYLQQEEHIPHDVIGPSPNA